MGTASRPGSPGNLEIESADDFILNDPTLINHASFTGLLPTGASLSDISQVVIELYRVFPKDSNFPADGKVPTRVNSPSDVAFTTRDSAASELTFNAGLLRASFTVNNSVVNGIHPIPNQATGGDGFATGEEVQIDVAFTTPLSLPADHYFFVPQVLLGSPGDFLWLSAPRPILPPGSPITPDLQEWIRNGDLDPDWLRVGTDIVGSSAPPTFNGTFTLSGTVPDASSSAGLLGLGLLGLLGFGWRCRVKP